MVNIEKKILDLKIFFFFINLKFNLTLLHKKYFKLNKKKIKKKKNKNGKL
jgi:hypothetical protein